MHTLDNIEIIKDPPANHLKVKFYSDQIKLGFILTAEFLTEVLHFFKDRQ
ncbi:hypothetical protein ABIE48_003175 [Paenibacillus sp. OAE614]